jgi:hypothetical protein
VGFYLKPYNWEEEGASRACEVRTGLPETTWLGPLPAGFGGSLDIFVPITKGEADRVDQPLFFVIGGGIEKGATNLSSTESLTSIRRGRQKH